MIKYNYIACLKAAMRFVFTIYGLFIFMVYWAEAYAELSKISKMEIFTKIVNE